MRHRHDAKTAPLRSLPPFDVARPSELQALANAADLVTVEPGAVLHRAGHRASACYLIVAGTIDVSCDGTVVETLWPGRIVGVLDLLDHQPSTTHAVVATTVTALAITAPRMRALVEVNHVVRLAVIRQLAGRARELDRVLAPTG